MLDFIKAIIIISLVLGCICGLIDALYLCLITSKTDEGKKLRYELYQIVEKGRKHE